MDLQKFENVVQKIGDIEKAKVLLENTKNSKEHYTRAFRRLVELGAESYQDPINKAFWSFLTAWEQFKQEDSGTKRKSGRIRKMFEEHGAKGAIEKLVSKKDTTGFDRLVELDMLELSVEYLVVSNEDMFSTKTVEMAKEKLSKAMTKK